MHLSLRQSRDCKQGFQWYTCSANSFTGCCSVDPCGLSGCPDQSSSAASSSTVKPSRTVTLEIIKPPPTLAAQTGTTVSAITSILEGSGSAASATGSYVTNAGSVVEGAASTSPATSLPSPTQSSSSGSSISSRAPIIAGSAVGVVALMTIAILVWFCVRRRQHRKKSYISPGSAVKESQESDSLETSNDEEQHHLKFTDVFAPFGGYHKSYSVQEPNVSHNHAKRQQNTCDTAQPPVAQEELEDVPLSDTEKSSVAPPPITEHPALHLLPGQSPKVPVYHPGKGIMVSSALATEPAQLAKHLSLLEEHPAFRSSKTGPSSFSSHAHFKSHPALEKQHAQSSSPKPKVDLIHNVLANTPSQYKDRKHFISRTASIHSPNVPPHNHLNTSTATSNKSEASRGKTEKSLNKPLSLQHLSPTPKPLLKHASLPTILSMPSELPADVPQELDSNSHPKSSRLSRGDTTSTQTSTYSIPIGLGLENHPFSHARHTAPLESVREREPIYSNNTFSEHSKTPKTPIKPLSALTSPGLASPKFYPSPQSMHRKSPETSSEQYGYYVVSPDLASTPTKSGSQFTTFHSSPSPPAPPPGLFQSRKHNPPPSPPRRTSKPPPRQRANTPTPHPSFAQQAKPPTTTQPQFYPPLLAQKPKAKSSLGKGKEHVMAWATYRYHSSGGSSTDPQTPGSMNDSKSASPGRSPQTGGVQADAESGSKEERDKTPKLVKQCTRLGNGDGYGYGSGDSLGARRNLGTENDRLVRAHLVGIDRAYTVEMDGRSLKGRALELQDRWSGSTALTTSQALGPDAASAGGGGQAKY